MKKSTKFLSFVGLSLVALALAFTACEKDDEDKTPLRLSTDKVEVVVGQTKTVTVSNGASPYVAVPSDTMIISTTVDKSTISIKGVAKGTATVTVTDKDKKSGKIAVTVKDAAG